MWRTFSPGGPTIGKSVRWNPETISWTSNLAVRYNADMKMIILYLAVINVAAFSLMGVDKYRARKHLWRIPEHTLFAAALLGGSLGAIAGMYLWHHKTRHWYFVLGMPFILIVQIAGAVWIGGWFHVV